VDKLVRAHAHSLSGNPSIDSRGGYDGQRPRDAKIMGIELIAENW
jgi:hypothetical protein